MNAIITDVSRKASVVFAAILYSMCLVASAQAVVIDFETFPAGPFASFSQSGVTFARWVEGARSLQLSGPMAPLVCWTLTFRAKNYRLISQPMPRLLQLTWAISTRTTTPCFWRSLIRPIHRSGSHPS